MKPITTLVIHGVKDLNSSIQTDEVKKRQRTHWETTAKSHGAIDVFT